MAAANNIVGEVGLIVKPIDPNAQFQAGVDALIRKLEKQAQFQVKAAGLEQVTQQANGMANGFAEAAIQAAGVTAAVFALRGALNSTLAKFQGLFDQLRQAQAGFSSILKSDAAGSALLKEIQEFARVSPFVTQELVNYSQQLLGVGVSAQKIVPLLEDVGNIVSSVGGDTQNIGRVLFTLTQIQSIGRLAGQDAMQLQSALIPITKYLSEYLNKTTAEVKKLQEQGQISAETVFAAISAQGAKVEGAMLNATRNIGGARAVLSDTIQLMLQNQPVLSKINDEIFKAILKLSDALSSPEFTQAFNRFFDNIDKIYTGLQPFIAEMSKLGGSSVLLGLGQTASLLGVVGEVLESLPEPVMEAFARLLTAMALLKAPLMLLQYVTSIKTLSTAILPATTGLAKFGQQTQQTAAAQVAGTAATNNQTAAIEKLSRAQRLQLLQEERAATRAALTRRERIIGQSGTTLKQRAGTVIGAQSGKFPVAGAVAGGILSSSDNQAAQAGGSALLAGSTASFLGFGPAGVAGAAAIGAVISYTNSVEKKIREHVEEMRELGRLAAEAFLKEGDRLFGTEPSGPLFDYLNGVEADLNRQREELKKEIKTNDKGLDDKILEFGPGFGQLSNREKDVNKLNAELAKLDEQLTLIDGRQIGAFEPIKIGLDALLGSLNKTQPAYLALTDSLAAQGGPATRVAATNINKIDAALKTYGITLSQIADPAQTDRLISLINTWDRLTTAQQEATRTAREYNEALKKAQETAAAIFDPEQTKIEGQIAELNARSNAVQAIIASNQANSGGLSGLTPAQVRLAEADRQVKELQAELAISRVGEAAFAKVIAETQPEIDKLKAGGGKGAGDRITELTSQQTVAADAAKIAAITEVTELGTQAFKDQKQSVISLYSTINSLTQSYLDTYNRQNNLNDSLGSLFEVSDANTLVTTTNLQKIGDVARDIITQAQAAGEAAGEALTPKVVGMEKGALITVDPTDTERATEAQRVQAQEIVAGLEAERLALGATDAEFKKHLANLGLVDLYNRATALSGKVITSSLSDVAKQLGLTNQKFATLIGLEGQVDPNINIVITADVQAAIDEIIRLQKELAKVGSGPAGNRTFSDAAYTAQQDALAAAEAIIAGAIGVQPDVTTQNDQIADNAAKAAGEAADAAQKWADAVENATKSLTSSIESAVQSIVDAADRWIGSIKERTQYEAAVSASRLTRNANRQVEDLKELTEGIANLKGRGVSEDVIGKLGIDNVADVRQVRKLVNASDVDLAELTKAVSTLNTEAGKVAEQAEDERTRKNIAEGIKQAAETLGIEKFTKEQASSISNQFTITTASNAEEIALQILNILSAGRIG